jgi:hypothetical protein
MVHLLKKRPDRFIVKILISLILPYLYQTTQIGHPKHHDLVTKFRRVEFVPQPT